MAKINYRKLVFIPDSKNFSELGENVFNDGAFDVGDDGMEVEEIISKLESDLLLLSLLHRFADKQKIILLYQLLREYGFNLNHEDCAKTLSVTREHYMVMLKDVRRKATKVLQEKE